MVNTSNDYKALRNDINALYEIRILRGPIEYGMDRITSCTIDHSLFSGDGPQIGGTVSARCDLTLIEDTENWPRMASFNVQFRLVSRDGLMTSEWISFGQFYTDERSNDYEGYLTIIAFDGMMLLEQSWTDKIDSEDLPSAWPITSKAAADLLVIATGVEIDPDTVLDDTYAFIGLDTTSTAREVWATIAAGNGGNCVITRQGKIRLVPLNVGESGDSAIAGVAVASIAVSGSENEEAGTVPHVGYYSVNKGVMSLNYSEPLPEITGVILKAASGNTAESGDATGYVLNADCAFSDSLVSNLCLANTIGFQYKPFECTGSKLDPASDLGDFVLVNGRLFRYYKSTWNLNKHITCDFSAPFSAEVDHEYQVLTESAKTYKKILNKLDAGLENAERRLYSQIEQTESSIMTTVGEQYETTIDSDGKYLTLQSSLNQTRDSLTFEIQTTTDNLDELRLHYRFDENGETIGRSDSTKTITLSYDGIDMNVNNESVTHWNQDEMYAPRKVQIPVGGSLQLGNFIFQPRSSGNMSLLWVGD